MKLCLIVPLPPPYGGVANWGKIIESEIRKDIDIEISIINIAANKRPLDGRTIFDRVFYSGYVMLRAYYILKKQIRGNCPDVVHMTTSGGLGFYRDLMLLKLLRRKGIPSVYHVHFGRSVLYKEENGRRWEQIKKTVSMATTTIVIDKKTYGLLKPYANKIYEINNPIDVSSFKKFKSDVTGNVIVYIGWVIKTKGITELIDGFMNFNNENGGKYRLQIIGPGEAKYIAQLREKTDDSVDFVGEVTHGKAMNLLGKADALILPSYTEGFPNVVLEAMAMEKPVIASEVGAIPDMLSNNAGFLIRAKSADEVKKALTCLYDNNLRNQMAQKAYDKVKVQYDITPTYQKYKSVWTEALNLP